MFVSHRGRVTKVVPECVRRASVVEQRNELGHFDGRESLVWKGTRWRRPFVEKTHARRIREIS